MNRRPLLAAFLTLVNLHLFYHSYSQYTFDGILTSPHAFGWVRTISFDADGRIYVVDSNADNIQVFNADHSFAFKFGSNGTGNGQFKFPHAIAIDNTNKWIYVTDVSNHRVQKFTIDGQFISSIGGVDSSPDASMNGKFVFARGIAIDKDGNLYVSDAVRIQKFNSSGEFVSNLARLDQPGDLAVDSENNIYVAHWHGRGILKLSPSGTQLARFPLNDNLPDYPSGVAIDKGGQVYGAFFSELGPEEKFTIRKFTKDLVHIHSFGSAGSGTGQFTNLNGLSVASNGNVYVAESNRIQIFKPFIAPEIAVFYNATELTMNSDYSFDTTTFLETVDQTFTISNELGAGELILTNLVIPDGFSLVGNFPTTIPPYETATFTIRLTASRAGDVQGSLHFSTNDPNESLWKFNLLGTVFKAFQQIRIDDIGPKVFGDKPFKVSGTNSSGLPILFKAEGKGFVDQYDSVQILGAGTILISASSSETENYYPITKTLGVTVSQATQTISFDSIPDYSLNESPVTLNASATSGLPVSFKVNAGPADIISSNRVTFSRPGGISIEANQNGNENFYPAPAKLRYFEVGIVMSMEESVERQIVAYPNPARNEVHVDAEHLIGPIKLFDVMGKLLSTTWPSQDGATLFLDTVPTGVYFLQVQIAGQVILRKIQVRK